MSIKEKAGKAVKKTALVKNAIKFLSTFIGKLVFFIILIILLLLLVYIIVMVIAKDIAKLLGIDGATDPNDVSAQIFRDLANSGYSQLLGPEELVEYYAFEYAVLMDAARFMEETGTQHFDVYDKASVKLEQYTGDREMWAYLNAKELSGGYFSNGGAKAGDITFKADKEAQIAATTAANAAITAANAALSSGDSSRNSFFPINEKLFSGDHTEENLFYYTAINEYTGTVSLIPYLEIPRNADIVTYYIEYRNSANPNEALAAGLDFDLGDMGFVHTSRFEGGDNSANYTSFKDSYDFILNNLYPAQICSELNVNNTAAYSNANGSSTEKIDLYKQYSQGLYYGTSGVTTNHKIPLKILLERYLPNASLLSSWHMLNSDENKNEGKDLVKEIMKIYSEACLEGEEASGDKLLVKDVFKISAGVDETTKAIDLIDKTAVQDKREERYLDGKETLLLYDSYEALFDSRVWAQKTNKQNGTSNNSSNAQTGNSSNTTTNTVPAQSFEGGFSGDVMDDIKLILTHFTKNNKIGLSEYRYNRLIEDCEKIINPNEKINISTDDTSIKNGEYIIYTPIDNGKYLVDCQVILENDKFKEHYNLANDVDLSDINYRMEITKKENHEYYTNPYKAPEEYKRCFVPFMKVAFTHKNGLRITSIVISYNGNYYGYLVKAKEIDDLSKLSNKNTFAFFESRYMSNTTPRHWKISANIKGNDEESIGKWAVEDAFEGAGVEIGDSTIYITYSTINPPGTTRVALPPLSLKGIQNEFGVALEEEDLIENMVSSSSNAQISGKGVLGAGNLAIVRTPTDPLSRDYTDLLDLPTNTSISNDALANYEYNSGKMGNIGGEAIVTDKIYINLKALGYDSGDTINLNTSAIGAAIGNKLGRNKLETIAKLVFLLGEDYFNYSDCDNQYLIMQAETKANDAGFKYEGKSVSTNAQITDYSVVMPVKRYIIPIVQEYWDKKMTFYLVKAAKTWSGVKEFHNNISINGEYNDRDNWIYLINANPYSRGLAEFESTQKVKWRGKMYAPVFAGNDKSKTRARETDVQSILAQWTETANSGVRAADYYIRDLYSLINVSKGVKSGDSYIIEPIKDGNGKAYVNPDSYSYLYIPKEILNFDERSAEKAFWLDRLISTTNDLIDQEKENYLRSRTPTFTWQIVDYDLYEECQNDDGTSSVYALWMFGDQMSRSLYAIAANSSEDEAKKIMNGWGGYSPGMHQAADLYGRNQSTKIYNEVFDNKGEAKIKSTYNDGKVTLIGTSSTVGAGAMAGDNELVELNQTGGSGLYFNNQEVYLTLGGTKYKFNGSAAAVYGYELYRQTLILKDPEKAEEYLKKQLEEEMQWTEIRAIAPGIVTKIGTNATGGFVVYVQHSENVRSVYSHMKRYPLVQKGQYVGAGSVLGYEGTTGNSGTYHVHFVISVEEKSPKPDPVLYLYPFFTPFYYEEKAEEAGFALDSTYMSTSRTVFPYGQSSGASLPNVDADLEDIYNRVYASNPKFPSGDNFPSALMDDDGMVAIKNYVPYRVLVEDSSELYNEYSEGIIDYSKISSSDTNTLGNSYYFGEMLIANPDYFDEEFHKAVAENENKITGAKELMSTTP